MKKLMILGAIAAATVGYGAEASYLAQVYDVTLTLKTGVCKPGKATKSTVKYYESYVGKDNSPVSKGEEMGFRKQATRKITGVIWGCECETIAFPAWRVYRSTTGFNLGGYAFWDQAADTYYVLPNTVFGWNCLNRITADFKSVEGAWNLANDLNPQWMWMTGAGFGKASLGGCRSIISKISGSFAGVRWPGLDDAVGDCAYCGIGGCNVRPFCEQCRWWTRSRWLTAAYGSWSIKFNKKASNKLKNTARITQSYTFKKAGDLPTVLANMEMFVRNFGRLGGFAYNLWFNGAAGSSGASTRMSRLQLMLAYTYGIAPGAVTVATGPVVKVNPAKLFALDEDDDDSELLEFDDFDPESEVEGLEDLESAYLSMLGYSIMTAEDLAEIAEGYEWDEYAFDPEDCRTCIVPEDEDADYSNLEALVSMVQAFVDAS